MTSPAYLPHAHGQWPFAVTGPVGVVVQPYRLQDNQILTFIGLNDTSWQNAQVAEMRGKSGDNTEGGDSVVIIIRISAA